MAQKRVTPKGRLYLANASVGMGPGGPSFNYHLFKTNITPTEDDTNGTYAGSEADFSGYAYIGTSFPNPATSVGEAAVLLAAPITYTVANPATVTNNIYGYYCTNPANGDVLWAMRFDGAPLAMNAPGISIQITPELDFVSQYA